MNDSKTAFEWQVRMYSGKKSLCCFIERVLFFPADQKQDQKEYSPANKVGYIVKGVLQLFIVIFGHFF